MNSIFTIEAAIAFLTLCALELVLGIDNIIFISIISSKLPIELQKKARSVGLSLAVITRVVLLLSLSWVIGLTAPLFTAFGQNISGRDLILLVGGLFLIAKSTHEIHERFGEAKEAHGTQKVSKKFWNVIAQILVLDLVFSLDSVITAVGMANNIEIMIAAVVVSTFVMIFSAEGISNFVERNPTVKILALSFLLMIGITLIAEGLGQHISKGYIYFAMAFSFFVEMINVSLHRKK